MVIPHPYPSTAFFYSVSSPFIKIKLLNLLEDFGGVHYVRRIVFWEPNDKTL